MASPTAAGGGGDGDGDERVHSYGDVVLLRSDLAILRGPHSLNDRLIAFYFAHLARAGRDGDEDGDGDLLLLPPSIPYLLAHLPDPSPVAAPLRLARRRLALLPVNDNPDVSLPEGGSHWSLLVMDNTSSSSSSQTRVVHHDSLGGANLPAARRLAAALLPRAPLVEGPTPTQRNGYDCGVHVLAVAKAVCEWWRGGGDGDWFDAVRREADAGRVAAMREEVLRLILGLMEAKEKKHKEGSEVV